MHQPPLSPADLDPVPDQSPHYVRAVADTGEQHQIVAKEDIYAANGMKLFAKGAHINRSQCERLTEYKLRVPLDLMLSMTDCMDAAQLAREANTMLTDDPVMARLAERTGDPLGFRQALGALALPEPLCFRLTVMREQRAGLFQHSLRTAFAAYSLAEQLDRSNQDKQDLLMAGLCHDMGEMHTDPLLLQLERQLTPQERRYIHVHPITSYVVLRDVPGVSAGTIQAVLHHHERIDGSGYPYGLFGMKIHPLAKLLSLAELTETVLRRANPQRLDVLLRLNQRRLDPVAVNALRLLACEETKDAQSSTTGRNPQMQLTHVTEIFNIWGPLRKPLSKQTAGVPALGFIEVRMEMLRSMVLQIGINPSHAGVLLKTFEQENAMLNELQAALDELEWMMLDIADEIERKVEVLDVPCRTLVAELVVALRAA